MSRLDLKRGTADSARPPDGSEDGSILVWALLFSIITSAMIISHSTYMAANRKEMHVRYENVTLADSFARSGLVDTLAWFQRQPTQPVESFQPKLDPEGDPPLLDTLDPSIGLVREFEVRGNLWARYEARTSEAFDVSAQRGQESSGTVWDVGARGFLYRLVDPDLPFDQAPNRVVSATYLRTEMQGIGVVPPASAAIVTGDPENLDIGPNVSIIGGDGPGIAYPSTQTLGSKPPDGAVTATPALVPVVGFDDSPDGVFNMHLEQLASLSDMVVEAGSGSGVVSGTGGDGHNGSLGLFHHPSMLFPAPMRSGVAWGASVDDDDDDGGRGRHKRHGKRRLKKFLRFLRFFRRTFGSGGSKDFSKDDNEELSFASDDAGPEAVEITAKAEKVEWVHSGTQLHTVGRGQTATLAAPEEIADKAVYVRGTLSLDASSALNGRGLVVVEGDLVVADDNASDFRGVLFVNGNATIAGKFRIDGTLVVRGKLKIGYGAQPTVIQYDPTAVGMVKRSVERYRLSRTIRPGWAGRK